MQQGEQRASGDVLGDDGKLAGIVQTRPDKVDDAGVVEAAEDGHLPAEHVHVRLGAVRVGSVTANQATEVIGGVIALLLRGKKLMSRLSEQLPFDGHNFVPAFASVDSSEGAWKRLSIVSR